MRGERLQRDRLFESRSPGTARVWRRRLIPIGLLAATLGPLHARPAQAAPHPEPASRLSAAQRAALYHKWAVEGLSDETVEGRGRALRDIHEAIALEPDEPEHWVLLGRLQVRGEYDSQSRQSFRRAMILDPRNPAAYLELAAAWKRDWLRSLDTLSMLRAIGVLDTAASLRAAAADPWLRLVPLRYERQDFEGAALAAERALAGRPRRPEATLAAAYVALRIGDLERSDSLFRAAIPRLDPNLRAMFDDPSLALGRSAAEKGWKGLDPDPTTPENELQLEYWSRVAHAYLLFYDPDRPGTDARFQTYLQYGAPRVTAVNPNGTQLYFRTFNSNLARSQGRESRAGGNPGKPPVDFPTPIQVWQYPDLGMRVVMQDRSLHGRFEPQVTQDFDPASRPDPAVLKGRDDLISLGDGVAVFHRLPPREQRIETRAIVARFGGARARLLAQLEAPGGPADSLLGRWVVTDPAGRVRARGEQKLAIAACDPTERRGIQFTTELAPGSYQVSISVRGAGGKRGLYQAPVAIEPDPPGLGLSDLVLACGDPTLLVGGGSARFDANVDSRSAGMAPLVAYLEIYRLAPAPDGVSHFEYQCEVRRVPPADRRRVRPGDVAPLVSTSREESTLGAIRRQFVSVPVQSLPPGRYRLEVRVRDLVAGTEATRAVEFVRE